MEQSPPSDRLAGAVTAVVNAAASPGAMASTPASAHEQQQQQRVGTVVSRISALREYLWKGPLGTDPFTAPLKYTPACETSKCRDKGRHVYEQWLHLNQPLTVLSPPNKPSTVWRALCLPCLEELAAKAKTPGTAIDYTSALWGSVASKWKGHTGNYSVVHNHL